MLGLVALSEAPISALGGSTTSITLTAPTLSAVVGDGMDAREVTLMPLEVISFVWPDLTLHNFQKHDLEFAQNITMGVWDIDHPARIFQLHDLNTNNVTFGDFEVPTAPYNQDHKLVATHSRGAIEYGNLTFTFTVKFGETITETVQAPVSISETEQIVTADIWTEQTDSQSPSDGFTEQPVGSNPNGWTTQ